MKFEDSGLNNKIYGDMSTEGYQWNGYISESFLKGVTEGMTLALKNLKNEEKPTLVSIYDKNEKFVFGAYVEKIPAEQGYGYSVNYTFNKDNIPEGAEEYRLNDSAVYTIINTCLFEKHGCIMKTPSGLRFVEQAAAIAFTALKEYMRNNYTIDKSLEVTNYFEVTSSLDDGNVFHITFTPGEVLKQAIKDDESAQK